MDDSGNEKDGLNFYMYVHEYREPINSFDHEVIFENVEAKGRCNRYVLCLLLQSKKDFCHVSRLGDE